MRHRSAEEWEARLDAVMQELDQFLEEKYQGRYELHPARLPSGVAAHPSHDGLFSILAAFTLGIGSRTGKGYIVDIKLKTLEDVPAEVVEEIEQTAIKFIGERLPQIFPEAELNIEMDGPVIKIHGDLSLGMV